MKVILWLPICRPHERSLASHVYSSDDLWRREIETGCVPVPALDRVDLWPGEDGEDGNGTSVGVKSRLLAASGQWHVTLSTVVIDPSDLQESLLQADIRDGRGHRQESWWTYGEDGKVAEWEASLMAAGWVKQ